MSPSDAVARTPWGAWSTSPSSRRSASPSACAPTSPGSCRRVAAPWAGVRCPLEQRDGGDQERQLERRLGEPRGGEPAAPVAAPKPVPTSPGGPPPTSSVATLSIPPTGPLPVDGTPARGSRTRSRCSTTSSPQSPTTSRRPPRGTGRRRCARGRRRRDLPIAEYESLAAIHVVHRLAGLGRSELDDVRGFERAHRKRRTILAKIEQLHPS